MNTMFVLGFSTLSWMASALSEPTFIMQIKPVTRMEILGEWQREMQSNPKRYSPCIREYCSRQMTESRLVSESSVYYACYKYILFGEVKKPQYVFKLTFVVEFDDTNTLCERVILSDIIESPYREVSQYQFMKLLESFNIDVQFLSENLRLYPYYWEYINIMNNKTALF